MSSNGRSCFICGKRPVVGNRVSHSNRKTKRLWLPNLQAVRIFLKGHIERVKVCTKCLKAGKVLKAAAR